MRAAAALSREQGALRRRSSPPLSPRPASSAVDAAELVVVDYDALPAAVDIGSRARTGAPLPVRRAGSNVAAGMRHDVDDVLAGAEVVVRARFVNQRIAVVPMERDVIAAAEPRRLTHLWVSTQMPHGCTAAVADRARPRS